MPKDTFYNLSEEKQKRIFEGALQEFSERRFSDASINQIVKNADIPKGSFYQYFADKEDLYLYVTEEIARDIQGIVAPVDLNASFLENVRQRAESTIKMGQRRPEYAKIGALTAVDNSEFMLQLLKATNEKYIEMIERDKRNGLIKPETDSEVLMKMIYIFVINEYLYSGSEEMQYLKKVEAAVRMIKDGIAQSYSE